MNLNDKKVQYTIMAVLAGCGMLFMVMQFVILPTLRSWKEDSAKTVETQKKLADMREVVQSRAAVQDRIAAARTEIKNSAAHMPLPVIGNYLLGVEGYLHDCTSNSGVAVVSIAESDVLEIMPDYTPIKIYRVRVQSRSDFNNFARMTADIYKSNPLVSLSGLNIVAREDNPSAHDMSFVISWLIWSDPSKRPAFLLEGH